MRFGGGWIVVSSQLIGESSILSVLPGIPCHSVNAACGHPVVMSKLLLFLFLAYSLITIVIITAKTANVILVIVL